MRNLLAVVLVALIGVGLTLGTAHAKRFGGGRSFGQQRSFTPAPPSRAPSQPPYAPAAPAPGRGWLGPLAGLAAGGMLGYLLFGHGFQGVGGMDILAVVAIAAVALMLFRAFRRSQASQPVAYAGYGGRGMVPATGLESGAAPTPAPRSRPPGFDEPAFLHAAKVNFVRLQAANDARDLGDLRAFTTPEVFAEVSLDFRERGDRAQKTEVQVLDGELIEVATEGDRVAASVRFTGLIREESEGAATALDEIWNFVRSANDPSAIWLVAGVQQRG